MTEVERLKIIMELKKFDTQRQFAELLGVSDGTLSALLKGARNENGTLSQKIKTQLRKHLNVNQHWLETGMGDVFLPGFSEAEHQGGVPCYALPEGNLNLMEAEPEFFVNYRPFNDCAAYIPVYGDSMYPKFASGEVIAIKEITNNNIILWGEAYVIETDSETNNIRAIKMIHPHNDKDKLILRSSNPKYNGDTVIARKNISKLYIIKGKITKILL